MTWTSRIKEGAYTSPVTKYRLRFTYEDVGHEIEKKTSAFQFPETNGTLVQDLGHTGYRYSMRLWFHGPNYDIEANLFEELLKEKGIGVLEHPMYGIKNVVPFGAISRRDDLVSAANQCSFDVTFMETITALWPEDATDPAGEVGAAKRDYDAAAADAYAAGIPREPMASLIQARNAVKSAVSEIRKTMRNITNTVEDVQNAYNEIEDSIIQGIDLIATAPGAIAFQLIQLVTAPARAAAGVGATLVANMQLISSLLTTGSASSSTGFHTSDLIAGAAVGASVTNVVRNTFPSRTAALEAAEQVQMQLDTLVTWRENAQESLGLVDTGESYRALQNLVALTVGYMVQISFTLRQEVIITLDRPHGIIDLCAELYGSVDDWLDFFITSNSLTNEEILELPRGREIKYYI